MATLICKDTLNEEEVQVLALQGTDMLVTADGQNTGIVSMLDYYVEWADGEYAKARSVTIQDYLAED